MADKHALEASNKGKQLVDIYQQHQKAVKRFKADLNNAECALSNSEAAIIKWLVPKTAQIGQTYCLPVKDVFLEVEVVQSNARCCGTGERSNDKDYKLTWRPHEPI